MRKLNKRIGKGIGLFLIVLCCILAVGLPAEAARKNAWVTKSGKTYYYTSTGKKARGVKKIGKKYYYFGKKGVLYKKGWKKVDGYYYYFGKKKGQAYTGREKVGTKTYLFDAKGRRFKTGLVTYKGKLYYTKKGVIQTGWQTISGKTYYFGRKGAAYTGRHTIKGRKYTFSKTGVLKKKSQNKDEDPTEEKPQDVPAETEIPETEAPETEPPADDGLTWAEAQSLFMQAKSKAGIKLEAGSQWFEKSDYDALQTAYNAAGTFEKNISLKTAAEIEEQTAALEKADADCPYVPTLTYYPEQSRAVFDSVNVYRKSKGIPELVWNENFSKRARLEAGYGCYVFSGIWDMNSENYEAYVHHNNHQSSTVSPGMIPVEHFVGIPNEGWIDGSHILLTEDKDDRFGAVAVYSYNDAMGNFWYKAIYSSWSRESYTDYNGNDLTNTATYTTAPSSLWEKILNPDYIDHTVIR